MTKTTLQAAGKTEVCSICGDSPASDYKVIGARFTQEIGASIRLCDDCRDIRLRTQNESFAKF